MIWIFQQLITRTGVVVRTYLDTLLGMEMVTGGTNTLQFAITTFQVAVRYFRLTNEGLGAILVFSWKVSIEYTADHDL